MIHNTRNHWPHLILPWRLALDKPGPKTAKGASIHCSVCRPEMMCHLYPRQSHLAKRPGIGH